MSSTPPPQTTLFRPSKKRKIYRQRPSLDDEDDAPSTTTIGVASSPPAQTLDELIASESISAIEAEDTTVPISEILRLRKKNKRLVGGVEFKAQEHSMRDKEGGIVLRDGDGDVERREVGGVPRKFLKQTGILGGDLDKHMMAYIDSELAKRQVSFMASNAMGKEKERTASPFLDDGHERHEWRREKEIVRQPATLGKLQEIDLGEEERQGNVKRTEVAWRKLGGEDVAIANDKGKGKVRLGRDGKPMRGKKRRASEDIRRDKAVEEVLRENRLEMYEELQPEATIPNDDRAADDRIAEDFVKQMLDEVSARRRKKPVSVPAPARGPGAKKEEEVLKGPKLGGSRSARAAMRETLLKAGKK